MTEDPGARIARLNSRFQRLDKQRRQALDADDLTTAEDRTRAMVEINAEINRLMEQVRRAVRI